MPYIVKSSLCCDWKKEAFVLAFFHALNIDVSWFQLLEWWTLADVSIFLLLDHGIKRIHIKQCHAICVLSDCFEDVCDSNVLSLVKLESTLLMWWGNQYALPVISSRSEWIWGNCWQLCHRHYDCSALSLTNYRHWSECRVLGLLKNYKFQKEVNIWVNLFYVWEDIRV